MVNSERRKTVLLIRRKYKGRKLPIEFYREVAASFGGKCLSPECADSNDSLEFQCKSKHIWKSVGASIAQGNWCGECQRLELAESRKWTLAMCQDIAKSKGGQCLSSVYVNTRTPMEWECKREHRWFQKAKYIKINWCRKCCKMRDQ
jgi:hypothetical protein